MSVVRAFLSYTGADQDFVEAVATRLGRASCVVDKACFHAGDEFVRVIESKLDESAIFVLFASRRSLDADWVNFEIEAASLRRVGHRLKKALVVALDSTIPIEAYPLWMRSGNIRQFPSADLAAREIRSQIEILLAQRMPLTFVGRTRELQECEGALAPMEGELPRLLVLTGLEGIGRRSLCRAVAVNLLQLRRIVPFGIDSADSLADVAFRLQAQLEPPSTPERLKMLKATMDEQLPEELVLSISTSLATMLEHGELPVFIDEGGIVGNQGSYTAVADALFVAISDNPRLYAIVIVQRRPPEHLSNLRAIPTVSVQPLEVAEVCRLVSLLLRGSALKLSQTQLESLAARIKGYPPSAYYAVKLLQRYGADLTDRAPNLLEDFQASTFVRYLREQHALSDVHQRLLVLLSAYTPLPLKVIERVVGGKTEALLAGLTELIDLSLVIPDDGGLYGLAGPVEVAVRRVFGSGRLDHRQIAVALQEYVDSADDPDRHLILCQLAFRAASYAGAEKPPWAIALARDLVQMAKRLYHDREYERSIEYSREVLSQRPNDMETRDYFVRGLIQLERFTEARSELLLFQKRGLLREYHFLHGFLERKQGRPEVAIGAYKRARQVGRKGIAIHRELALCSFLLGKVDDARGFIELARESDPDNRYLLDLELKIALARRDLKTADTLVSRLEHVDSKAYVLFRRSWIADLRGSAREALDRATEAVKVASEEGKPPFEMLSQVAKCLIIMNKFDEASEVLRRLDRIFSGRRDDVRTGLWCKWEIAQRRWDDAAGRWEKLRDRTKPVHLALRRSIVEGLLERRSLSAIQRDALEKERAAIDESLKEIGLEGLRTAEVAQEFSLDL